MLYEFSQNNSGGRFVFDADAGITHRVVIEAESEEEAIEKALGVGLYFNGCDAGIDCNCCGDRWSTWTREIENLESWLKDVEKYCWLSPDVFVHYQDGTVKGYLEKNKY